MHFDDEAIADRFVRASYAVILVPVWIQLALAIIFGAIAGVLLYRTQKTRSAVENELNRQERERMLVTAEAISLLAAIWVTFQGLLAVRLIMMWQLMCCGLGDVYYQTLVVCIVLSAIGGCAGRGLSSVSQACRASTPRTSTGGFAACISTGRTRRCSCRAGKGPAGPLISAGRKLLFFLDLFSS